jgi:hypothetical protein
MHIGFICPYNIISLRYEAVKRATFGVILAILACASRIRTPTGEAGESHQPVNVAHGCSVNLELPVEMAASASFRFQPHPITDHSCLYETRSPTEGSTYPSLSLLSLYSTTIYFQIWTISLLAISLWP